MSELFLVRHAQASFGTDNYDRLSELGHRQSRWLGEYFADLEIEFDSVVTGCMNRHRETAAGIARGMRLEAPAVEEHAGWNEFDFGKLFELYAQREPGARLDGAARPEDYYRVLKSALLAWSEGAIDLDGSGMESWSAFQSRVAAAVDSLRRGNAGRKILVVSSGGALSAALQRILDLPNKSMVQLNLQTSNTGLHRCFFNQRSISLASFNATPHLESRHRKQFTTHY